MKTIMIIMDRRKKIEEFLIKLIIFFMVYRPFNPVFLIYTDII